MCMKLSKNAQIVLESRYLKKDDQGRVVETSEAMFRRVAKAVAAIDKHYKDFSAKKTEKSFYEMMTHLEFLPNSPTLMNAGEKKGQLAACFVLPVPDSLEGIFEAIKESALIHQSGGGTGFSFSNLRPKNDIVKTTHGVSSGPVSFMNIFDVATDTIKQGGRRRGANMGILDIHHPDILEFINSKNKNKITNFNISVAVDRAFMKAVFKNKNYNLINPRTQKKVKTLNAKKVFKEIAKNACKYGDPGIIFLDEINKYNPTPEIGPIESTNPCGEQPLLSHESCTLGSINVSKIVKNKKTDWDKLRNLVHTATHFLDNVIDANTYPSEQIRYITAQNRKIGLGIMGWADFLILLGIPYASKEAIRLAEKLMKFISKEAKVMSQKLAKTRGPFTNFKKSIFKKGPHQRNATLTTIAPTGTLSIIADCSSGIEPLYAISFKRNVLGGKTLKTVSRFLAPTAYEIAPLWHIKMQAAFQKYTDNAVSKTVNLPASTTPKDVEKIYKLAYKLKCKGVTVYRDTSKKGQVLVVDDLL